MAKLQATQGLVPCAQAMRRRLRSFPLLVLLGASASSLPAQLLDKQTLLEAQTFWDNRDWDWYREHIPFFESPGAEIDTTYYYRWELVTKHLTYGSPDSGYTFTEFIDRPFWSGAYGAISCPAGHQLYEARWLRDPRIARDFARYWFRTPGAEPRRYSTWLADALWALHLAHPDERFITDLLPDLVRNYEAWEASHFVPEVGLFWQTGHDDGMEININSRQTRDRVRGAPGFRPTLNSYLWADALAISRIARLAGDAAAAESFTGKAARLKEKLQELLWDPERQFFFHRFQRDEELDGHVVKAMTLTHQSGRFAGSPYGRELIGYVPWQFNLPDPGYEDAWRFLMDPERFFAPFGPTVTERRDPLFLISARCCVWSGQSWPYATTQTLVAMANLLDGYRQSHVTKEDYFTLLRIYALTHQKDGRPYIAEAAHPDTGSWEGHDSYNHSEHYFHSGFTDLVITGLAGLRPRDDDLVEVHPLAPEEWDYFALDDVAYRGRRLAIAWDRQGSRYGLGPGLHILADGAKLASAPRLGRLAAKLPPAGPPPRARAHAVNFAVNNDGRHYPRVLASFAGAAPPANLIDGNYWYHLSPPNRWSCEGSENAADWCGVDFGLPRRIHTVKLYVLDDGAGIVPPAAVALEHWDGSAWVEVPGQERKPAKPEGRRANVIRFPALETAKIRAVLTHAGGGRSGLSELEVWGDATPPVPQPPPPAGNLALNARGEGHPRASASFTSRYDKVEMANDGRIVLGPSPHNRWTAFGSPNAEDWLEIDFGKAEEAGRIDLYIYDDRGGVQPPSRYTVEHWDGEAWREAAAQVRSPPLPAGGIQNTVVFEKVRTSKIRVVFLHRGPARSGVSEIEIWRE
jgi:hypothetical protein